MEIGHLGGIPQTPWTADEGLERSEPEGYWGIPPPRNVRFPSLRAKREKLNYGLLVYAFESHTKPSSEVSGGGAASNQNET
jgi:hypothetical protein